MAYRPSLLCCQVEGKGALASTSDHYFVYWKVNDSVLGVTNLVDRVYEQVLDKRARKVFMKNCGDQLLDIKWLATFKNKSLKVCKFEDDKAEIGYLNQRLTIKRAAIEPKIVIADIIVKLLADRDELEETVEGKRIQVSDPVTRWIRRAATLTQDPMNKNRRIRLVPKPSSSNGSPNKKAKIEEPEEGLDEVPVKHEIDS
ncbi:unnamed protein product [Bursaphelenchus xylophilus]|uniref:(pine wood nematode) hypothetical protein n=1 Tax=Bursaphelenchus xylophilus TaxID=6326 RepID=A0A1I7S5S5_BURXY|nr:unnamed protein product [Bursaphelenchus xylophilus]CAG9125015.1 unnamed protein product [Bursaphelenchus xylophilus]